MNQPRTLEEARAQRYGGPWRTRYQEGFCAAKVPEGGRSVILRQCARKVKEGTLYCFQHRQETLS